MKIHLMGDSIVQGYKDEEFIAGWGQYLCRYLESVQIVNHAIGGRSSRMFINEGRFDRAFEQVASGDYVLIEFCHNDDASKSWDTMVNRLVELGMPDEEGRYPIIPGIRADKDYIPEVFLTRCREATENVKNDIMDKMIEELKSYPGDSYYPYSEEGSQGSYKWFLKQYVDESRLRGAVPILVAAPARGFLDEKGELADGPGLHGGDGFSYIRALEQLAQEMQVCVVDLFGYSKEVYEKLGQENLSGIMAVKKGCNTGVWPEGYDEQLLKKDTVMEKTHFNKYGACLLARELVRQLSVSADISMQALKECILHNELLEVYEKIPAIIKGYKELLE